MVTPSLASLVSSINAVPADQNLLQSSTFQMTFSRLPYLNFFLQEINIPGIHTNPPIQATPFVNVPIAANKMTYEYLSLTFALDEGLWSWTSVCDWLYGIAIPESFETYKNLSLQQRLQMKTDKPQFSDGILTILSNKNNPLLSIQFTNLFPVSLTGIQLSTKINAETILTATAQFGFAHYDINRQI